MRPFDCISVSENFVGLFVATIVHFLVGGFFYNVDPFRSTWVTAMRQYTGDSKWPDTSQYNFGRLVAMELVLAFVKSYVALHFLTYLQITALHDALLTGFWLWIGFIMPTVSHDCWQNVPCGATIVNQLADLSRLMVVCLILTLL